MRHSWADEFGARVRPAQFSLFSTKTASRKTDSDPQIGDEDAVAVGRFFQVFGMATATFKGDFQLIVVDHASRDIWGGGLKGIYFVEEWRKGKKTNNVYPQCAIKSLAAKYPRLVVAGAPVKLKVQFFKYAETRAGQVTDLTGGVGGICKLLKSYQEDVERLFKAPVSPFPVIVLIDNDNGAHGVYERLLVSPRNQSRSVSQTLSMSQAISMLCQRPSGRKKLPQQSRTFLTNRL